MNRMHALIAQLLQSAACNALHPADQRLARFLLQLQDRVGEVARLALTQETVAEVLGVQRNTVNTAMVALRRAGAVEYRRGRVTVLDRVGLEAASCECYGAIRARYERLLSPAYPAQG
jgi:CRP-like cAMP-binding protein